VKENFGAVKGSQGAVVFSISGREGLSGSCNPEGFGLCVGEGELTAGCEIAVYVYLN